MSKCDDMTHSQASFNQIKTGIRILHILPGGSRSILISVGEPLPFHRLSQISAPSPSKKGMAPAPGFLEPFLNISFTSFGSKKAWLPVLLESFQGIFNSSLWFFYRLWLMIQPPVKSLCSWLLVSGSQTLVLRFKS